MEEEWKVAFANYEISNLGNCRRKLKNGEYKNVNVSINKDGYKCFNTTRDGEKITKYFHHLVAFAFIGERPDGSVINHIDKNRSNNNVSNLQYITHREIDKSYYKKMRDDTINAICSECNMSKKFVRSAYKIKIKLGEIVVCTNCILQNKL